VEFGQRACGCRYCPDSGYAGSGALETSPDYPDFHGFYPWSVPLAISMELCRGATDDWFYSDREDACGEPSAIFFVPGALLWLIT